MNNFFKRKMIAALAVVMVFVSSFAVMPAAQIDAYAMSHKTAQSKVKSLNKKIKKLKSELKSDRIKDAKEIAEIHLLTGFIQSPDPLVVADSGSGMKLYFESDAGLTRNGNLLEGYYKLTNNYVKAGGDLVRVAVAAEYPHYEADTQAELDAATKERDALNKALKDTVIIEDVTVTKGSTQPLTIHWKYGTPSYNTFKYKAKKSGIATISSDGTVTGKKKGKTTFTAKMSASGKKVTFSVRVV